MKWVRNFFFLLVLPIKLLSCSSGYKKIDGKWYYVTYDEGNWADRHNLDIDLKSFEVLDNPRFGKDNTKVFFEGRLIENADASTFKLIRNDYGADHAHVFYQTYLLFGSNPNDFKVLKFPYSRDNTMVFCGNIPMEVDDIEKFSVKKKGTVITTQLLSIFLKENKTFANMNTSKCKYVIFADGEAETKTSKYKGLKKIN